MARLTPKMRLIFFKSGAIIERCKPGFITELSSSTEIITELERIIGQSFKGLETDDIDNILNNYILKNSGQITANSKDPYEHAMGII